MSLVVKAKLKEAAKGYNVAGDLADALDKLLQKAVAGACKRAEANGRKTVMAKDVACCCDQCSSKGDMLVVKSKIKDYAKGCNVAGDLADSLNCTAHGLVKAACTRAEGNSRKTVMAKDL